MLCPMVDSHRKTIAVSAQEVYKETDTNGGDVVTGAHAPELAKTLFNEIRQHIPKFKKLLSREHAWVQFVMVPMPQQVNLRERLQLS